MANPVPTLPPPAALLRRLGLRPRKRWSQSFLVDSRVLDSIVRAADLQPSDEVLEVGPGLGALTTRLARVARRVVAVEIDRALADALSGLLRAPNVEVVCGDILHFDPATAFAGAYKVVANLPYHITSPTILRFLLEVRPPTRLVVTIQREVAERIAAGPGQMSYLAVAVQLMADATIVRLVPKTAFYPPPRVESAVLKLLVHRQPREPVGDVQAFLRLVQAGFSQPRKQLANSLAQGLGWPKERATAALRAAGVDPSLRPQALDLAAWHRVFEAVAGME